MRRILLVGSGLLGIMLCSLHTSHAQAVDDLTVQYEGMVVSSIQERAEVVSMPFYRHSIAVQVGRGAWSLGAIGTATRGTSPYGPEEEGLMLTAGYGHILSDRLRLETFGRLGVTKGHFFGSPLYATDTDLRLNMVGFLPDGWGWLQEQPLFPSAYAGAIINRYGRVQLVGGMGVWWNHWNGYLTGFAALNGVADPGMTRRDANIAFANLRNAGISFSLARDIGAFTFALRHNVPIENGGRDTTFTLTYRHFWGG